MWPTFHIVGGAVVEGDDILAYGVCKTSTSADHAITLTPATNLPGIQDGDYLVVWLYCGRATESRYCFTPLSGWTVISGRSQRSDASAANYLCVGRFYNASTDSAYTWNHERSVNTTICLQAFAYRGISRRYPVDQIQGVLTLGNGGWGYLPDHQTMWGRRRRIHHASAVVAQAIMYRSSSTGPMLPLTAANYLGGGTLDVGSYGFASNMHLDCFHERVGASALENLLVNQVMNGGEIGAAGMSAVNIIVEDVDHPDGGRKSDLLRVTGGGVSAHHYLAHNVTLTEGQQGFVLARLGGYVSYSTDHRWIVAVVRPDGIIVGQAFSINSNGVAVSTLVSMEDPDLWFGQGCDYSGLPSWKSFYAGIAFTANETGTYQIRLYPIKETATGLSYNPGSSDSYATQLGFYGCSCAIGHMPDMIATGDPAGAGLNDGNIVPNAVWKFGTTDRAYYTDAYGSGFVLNKAALTAFQAPILLPVYPETVNPVMLSSTAMSGTVQPYRHAEETGLHLMSDRVLLPYYRMTEGGADVQGRYYWEVEVGTTSKAEHRVGFCTESSMTMWYDGLVSLVGPGIVCRGDNRIYVGQTHVAGTGNWFAGDILGFALDIVGNYAAIYRNGDLKWSGALSSIAGVDQACFRVFCGLEDESGGVGITPCQFSFNFTGPFAYAKPSGYSAFDPFNDAS